MGKTSGLLTTTGLKLIAAVSMLIDHFGAAFFIIYTSYYDKTEEFAGADNLYQVLRAVGRSAFPIYCFLLTEGFFYTRSRCRYLLRLFIFSILSEVPFDLALHNTLWKPDSQNVFFTLFIGFLAMFLMEKVRSHEKWDTMFKTSSCMMIGMTSMLAAHFLRTDYDAFGVFLILILYLFHHHRGKACIYGYLSMIWEYMCFPAFLLIYGYNGQKGRNIKYFFYLFYPLHLLALYGIRVFLMR